MRNKTEFYRCGMLNFVTGETGSGKSYIVKEWLKKKKDSKRVVIVGIPGEYEEFVWRSDVVLFNHMDPDMESFVMNSQTVKEADIIIFDGTPPSSLRKIILHLLNRVGCEIVIVCTERHNSIGLPIRLEWTKEESFNELIFGTFV